MVGPADLGRPDAGGREWGREGPGSWGFLLGVALGVALYTERGVAWTEVMAADLGTSAPAHAACPGGDKVKSGGPLRLCRDGLALSGRSG